jgi:2',3'-cyclic-nucleotide 2'-phosphodiesterase
VARTAAGVTVGVVNVMGRVFMMNLDDPFAVVLREIERVRERARIVFVDFHAEATSEKIAMGWHLDGKVTAVVGTHTHVQTADERILPNGTAYLTDVGMTGPHDSIIGVDISAALGRFLTGMPARFETATGNPRLNAVIVEADAATGRAVDIERVSYSQQEIDDLAGAPEGAGARLKGRAR